MNLGGVAITPQLVIAGGLAGLSALAAVGVVAFQSAIRSALCLVFNFIILAFIYFTLGAEMVGITQVIVYTGAIMVLFLFVIMLLNLSKPQMLIEATDKKVLGGLLMGAIFFGLIAGIVLIPTLNVTQVNSPENFGGPGLMGRSLFTSFVWPFEVASFLLLVGMVGSILLAKRKI